MIRSDFDDRMLLRISEAHHLLQLNPATSVAVIFGNENYRCICKSDF